MLKLNTALRVQVCCCLWVSIGAAERSPGSVAEFNFGFLFLWSRVLGWVSRLLHTKMNVASGLEICLTQCWPEICVSHLGNILLWGVVWYTIIYSDIIYDHITNYNIIWYDMIWYIYIIWYTILYYTILYYNPLYYTIICYAMIWYYIILYYIMIYYLI